MYLFRVAYIFRTREIATSIISVTKVIYLFSLVLPVFTGTKIIAIGLKTPSVIPIVLQLPHPRLLKFIYHHLRTRKAETNSP